MTAVEPVRRNRGFLWLWGGQGVSIFGEQFTSLAVPVLAVTLLHAVAWQMGILNAAGTAAFLIVGLPAGAWVDRWLKRRVMVTADIVRTLALAAIPILWYTHLLEIWQLIIIVTLVGVASVFFDVGYQSYIPLLVKPEQVGPANSTLEATAQVARIGGPAIAGVLLTIVSAPGLIIVDSLSYIVSFASLSRIKDHEIAADPKQRRPLYKEIAEGVRFVARQPLIRSISGTTATSNFFSTLAFTLYPIFALRTLGIGSLGFGITLSAGAIGGLLGATLTPRIARWIGGGRVIIVSAFVSGIAFLPVPLAALLHGADAVPLLAAGEFLNGFCVLVYNITQVTLRQRLCPPRLLGRMNASIRCLVWGVMPIAALVSGGLGGAIGVLPTMWIGFAGGMLAGLWVLFSPLRGLRDLPTSLDPVPETGVARGSVDEQSAPRAE
ncbi:MAG TPA: MFS transporter [Galbitalea sp.]|jgi:MFS family permease|nr:MFS transporter [Galbitalea sp.]